MRQLTVILASILTLAFASNVFAFTVNSTSEGMPVHWRGSAVGFSLDSNGSDQVPVTDAQTCLIGAIGAWSAVPGSTLTMVYDGQLSGQIVGYEAGGSNTNIVTFYDRDWPFGVDALALTITTFQRSTGVIIDADIAVNSYAHSWSTDGESGVYDLTSALAHELGHAVGLNHASDTPNATMFDWMSPGETGKRTLHDDDAAGYLYLYSGDEIGSLPAMPTDDDSDKADSDEAPRRTSTNQSGFDTDDDIAPVGHPLGCSAAGSPNAPNGSVIGLLLVASIIIIRKRSHRARR